MEIASTQNPVQWTLDPVIPCRGTHLGLISCLHHALRVPLRGYAEPCHFASSIDSLVRVSRRVEGGTAIFLPSSTAHRHRIPSGGQATSQRPPSEWCSHHAATTPQAFADPATWRPSGDSTRVFLGLCQHPHRSLASWVGAHQAISAPEWGRHAGLTPLVWRFNAHSTTEPWALTSRVPPQGLPGLHPHPEGQGLSGQPGAGPRSLGRADSDPVSPSRSSPPLTGDRRVWRLPDWVFPTAPLTAVPAEASGTFNPLCKVLCIIRSLYLCSIGPRSVFLLVMDTPHTSNCSPKPLYSGMSPATPPTVEALLLCVGDDSPLW